MKICLFSTKDDLPPEWQDEHPVLCVAGRTLIDEAAAIMLGQLSTAHGLAARVEAAEALSTAKFSGWRRQGLRSFVWFIWMLAVRLTCVIPYDGFVANCRRRRLFCGAG